MRRYRGLILCFIMTMVVGAFCVGLSGKELRQVAIDFSESKLEFDDLNYGKPFTLKITNINTINYKISVTTKNAKFVTPMPDVIKKLFLFGVDGFIQKDTTSKNVPDTISVKSNKFRKDDEQTGIEAVVSNYKEIEEKYNAMLDIFDLVCLTESNIKLIRDESNEISKNSKKLLEEVETLKTSIAKDKDQLSRLEKIGKNAKSIHDECEKIKKRAAIKDAFTYSTGIIYAMGDNVEVTIEVQDENKNVVTKKSYIIDVFRIYRFDYTTGLLFSFGLNNHSYYTVASESDTTKSVIHAGKTETDPQLAAGAQVNVVFLSIPYLSPYVNPFATVGVGIGTEDLAEAQLYLGGGIIIGRTEILALSGGWVWGYADRLKDRYSVGGLVEKGSVSDGDLVEKRREWGMFAGLTFNIAELIRD